MWGVRSAECISCRRTRDGRSVSERRLRAGSPPTSCTNSFRKDCFDEHAWETLVTEAMLAGERVELERVRKMGVYRYAGQGYALAGTEGNVAKATGYQLTREQRTDRRSVVQVGCPGTWIWEYVG